MKKLFGTDGVRGVANQYPMTPEVALKMGRAIAAFFGAKTDKSQVIIGKDTRVSCSMLEHAVASGLCSMGIDVTAVGIVPTPAVAFLISKTEAMAGVMISASHNPFYDNGMKCFDENGNKLTDETEASLETLILNDETAIKCNDIQKTGMVTHDDRQATNDYIEFLKQTIPANLNLSEMKIVLDCANGATYRAAPALFSELGAQIDTLFIHPDGLNINHKCGSQHPEKLIRTVIEQNANIGLAFDGDGDRLIAVDEKGNIVTGDRILGICAGMLKDQGCLDHNKVVITVMSNIGLKSALDSMGIEYLVTDVGDRYVLEQMKASDAVLGGEDSGHMIFLRHHTTGDGILTALKLIEAMVYKNKPLSVLAGQIPVYPQVLMNVNVKEKPDLQSIPSLKREIQAVESILGKDGRVLVRYSGTQPLCRIMVEGPSPEETGNLCRRLTDAVRNAIGDRVN